MWILILLSWLIWPTPMWVVGWVFESRTVPLWRHQSRAFIPGDLMLGPMVVVLLSMPAPTVGGVAGVALWTISFCVGWTTYRVLWRGDAKNYPPRAMNSPTKVLHDIVGEFGFPATLTWLGAPRIVGSFLCPWPTMVRDWGIVLGLAAAYLACVAWDAKRGYTKVDVYHRHPHDWAPIWFHKRGGDQ